MNAALLTLLHVAVTAAKLRRTGGVRAVIAENLLLKQQLLVLRRARQRAPNLTVGHRGHDVYPSNTPDLAADIRRLRAAPLHRSGPCTTPHRHGVTPDPRGLSTACVVEAKVQTHRGDRDHPVLKIIKKGRVVTGVPGTGAPVPALWPETAASRPRAQRRTAASPDNSYRYVPSGERLQDGEGRHRASS